MDPNLQEQATDMSPWASRRKTFIVSAIILVLAAVSFFVFWKFWYLAPNCFDGKKNGDESGVDCGGSCTLVCNTDMLSPIVKWDPRLFEVSSNVWSVLVYVENLNVTTDAVYVPYVLTIYDDSNSVLETRKGATILPRNKTVGIFEGNFNFIDKKPKRAVFEIDQTNIKWNKNTKSVSEIKIINTPILNLENAPKIKATISNNGIETIKNIELVAAIFDGSDNAIAASRTFIESLSKDENTDVFFTWPKPFVLGKKVCDKFSDIILILDRSGSMAALSSKPPQPLTLAKDAANSFVEQLNSKDQVGVISFATLATNPIDLNLTSNFNLVENAINAINIESSSTQYTNIFDALHFAWQELISARSKETNSKVIILLTDGVANNPKNPQGRTESDDIKYAESLALKESADVKKDNIIIYTIGLGNKINEPFLKSVASELSNYFFAPTGENLEKIYKNISSDICQEVPARVEITYKIFGDLF